MNAVVKPWWIATVFAIFFIAGCAQPPGIRSSIHATDSHWEGRISLRVDSDPVQQLSGGFLLDGQASAGELKLTTPLGTVASQWVWRPGQATMTHDGQTRQFDNMATLTEQLTGVALPLEAVFAWLQGRSFPVDGWRVDLDNWPRGRILAHRVSPSPAVELRLILDR